MRRTAALAVMVSLVPAVAAAHPHVFVDVRQTLMLDASGAATGMRIDWTFDELYTAWAIDGLDTNANGTYEPEELAVLARDNITNLEEYRYFTYANAGGQPVAYGQVTESLMTLENGLLRLRFTLPFAAPFDASSMPLTVETFDPTFYVAMILVPDTGATLEGTLAPGCELTRTMAEADPRQAYLPDELLGDPAFQGFGAQFADKVTLACRKPS